MRSADCRQQSVLAIGRLETVVSIWRHPPTSAGLICLYKLPVGGCWMLPWQRENVGRALAAHSLAVINKGLLNKLICRAATGCSRVKVQLASSRFWLLFICATIATWCRVCVVVFVHLCVAPRLAWSLLQSHVDRLRDWSIGGAFNRFQVEWFGAIELWLKQRNGQGQLGHYKVEYISLHNLKSVPHKYLIVFHPPPPLSLVAAFWARLLWSMRLRWSTPSARTHGPFTTMRCVA